MDFNAWFEVFLGGEWQTFDARNNVPRIGRILIGGRDATIFRLSTRLARTSSNRSACVLKRRVPWRRHDRQRLFDTRFSGWAARFRVWVAWAFFCTCSADVAIGSRAAATATSQ